MVPWCGLPCHAVYVAFAQGPFTVSIFAGRVELKTDVFFSLGVKCQARQACVAFRNKADFFSSFFASRPGSAALYRQKPTHHNSNQNGQLSPRHTSPFAVDRRTTDVGATSPAGQSAGVAR